MENKYLNEAIIGNKKMIATFTSKGEMQRIYFPSKDNRQYINYFHTGVKINESDLIYLHDDINNTYKQYYDTDTNILNTEITNTYFNLKIVQTDYVLIKENILLKKYTFLNENKIDLNTQFYIHSELLSDTNNFVGCKIIDGGMMQYAHDFTFSTFAKGKDIIKHQINGSINNIKRTEIHDKDYIGMSKDTSIAYEIGTIKPGEKKELEIAILIDENKNISDIEDEVERIRRIDFDKEYHLLELIRAVHEIDGIERIRLGSLEPGIITEEFAEGIAKLPKMCPHFHLSLQSGCDATLKRMNRRYTSSEYAEKCELLRKYFPNPALTTDVIVGFPGETEEEFKESYDFVDSIDFYETHIFKYSRREGTKAAVMPDQVDEQIKAKRSAQLIELGEKKRAAYEQSFQGKEVEVLVEEDLELNGKKVQIGHTKEYMKIALETNENLKNSIVKVQIGKDSQIIH